MISCSGWAKVIKSGANPIGTFPGAMVVGVRKGGWNRSPNFFVKCHHPTFQIFAFAMFFILSSYYISDVVPVLCRSQRRHFFVIMWLWQIFESPFIEKLWQGYGRGIIHYPPPFHEIFLFLEIQYAITF